MKNINCLRCNTEMRNYGIRKIQLGETGWILGDLPNLFAGSIEVDIYVCPQCGKIELFQAEAESEDGLAMVKCPKCGKMHECDYPKCPFCKYDYYKR